MEYRKIICVTDNHHRCWDVPSAIVTVPLTQRLAHVGDGLESLAFHPTGKFAVISCLDKGPDVATTSHLATMDLTSRPVRLLDHIHVFPQDGAPSGDLAFSATEQTVWTPRKLLRKLPAEQELRFSWDFLPRNCHSFVTLTGRNVGSERNAGRESRFRRDQKPA